jgi:hypothetical protein
MYAWSVHTLGALPTPRMALALCMRCSLRKMAMRRLIQTKMENTIYNGMV